MSQHKKQVWITCTQTLNYHICMAWKCSGGDSILVSTWPTAKGKKKIFSHVPTAVSRRKGSQWLNFFFSLFFPFKTYSKLRDNGSCVTLFLFGSRGGIYKLSDFYKGFLREVTPKPLTIIGPWLLLIVLHSDPNGLGPPSRWHWAFRSTQGSRFQCLETAGLRFPSSTLWGDNCPKNHVTVLKLYLLDPIKMDFFKKMDSHQTQ